MPSLRGNRALLPEALRALRCESSIRNYVISSFSLVNSLSRHGIERYVVHATGARGDSQPVALMWWSSGIVISSEWRRSTSLLEEESSLEQLLDIFKSFLKGS